MQKERMQHIKVFLPQSDVLYIYVFCLILIYNFLDIIIRLLLVSIAYQMEVSKPRFFVQY